MADFAFNIAKGRIAELGNRVEANDPTNSAFIVALFNTAATDATLRDLDTLAAIESDGDTAELTGGTYARKTLANGALTVTIDDTNDRVDVDFADQTWSALTADVDPTDLLIAYDSDTTGGTDANIVPLTWHDFAVTLDGSDVTAQLPAGGFFRAS